MNIPDNVMNGFKITRFHHYFENGAVGNMRQRQRHDILHYISDHRKIYIPLAFDRFFTVVCFQKRVNPAIIDFSSGSIQSNNFYIFQDSHRIFGIDQRGFVKFSCNRGQMSGRAAHFSDQSAGHGDQLGEFRVHGFQNKDGSSGHRRDGFVLHQKNRA